VQPPFVVGMVANGRYIISRSADCKIDVRRKIINSRRAQEQVCVRRGKEGETRSEYRESFISSAEMLSGRAPPE